MRKLFTLIVAPLMLAATMVALAPASSPVLAPTRAEANVAPCSVHTSQASYTTSTPVTYRLIAHVCLEDSGVNWRSRAHYHCTRDGQPWDGCRLNYWLVTDYRPLDVNPFEENTVTRVYHAQPGGPSTCDGDSSNAGYFSDSSPQWNGWWEYHVNIRAASIGDQVRFCLANATTRLEDITTVVRSPEHSPA